MERVTIDLKLSSECEIQIYGEYQPEEKPEPEAYGYPGCPSELDITGISFLKGGLMEYTQWANDVMDKQLADSIIEGLSEECLWEILSNLALEKYESIK